MPCYWLLTFLLISGKRGMIALRGEADALARRDPLTGIANRRALLEAIERRGREPVGLLVLDVDDFKTINTLARASRRSTARWVFVADALRASSRAADLPTRLGGDEFALLGARRIDAAGMEALAQRAAGGDPLGDVVRISAGWVVGAPDPSQLLLDGRRGARAAAKRAGKDRALSFSRSGRCRGRARAAAPCGPRPSAARPRAAREAVAVALRDLEHRPDEDAVHVAHERPRPRSGTRACRPARSQLAL